MWILLLILGNFLLFLFSVLFLIDKKQIKKIKLTPEFIIHNLSENIKFLLIIVIVVSFHLIEVNLIDSYLTNWVNYDYADIIKNFENGFVNNITNYWIPGLLHFFVFVYLILYIFTLWFTSLYFIIANKKQSLKALAYGLLIIYLIALPFYLLLPVTNVYTYYNSSSALESIIPSIDKFFYLTTTVNNCLPSLHSAMTILVAYCLILTGNKKLKYFGIFVSITVIISVVYLSIHWLIDVFTGITISLGVIFLLRHYMKVK